MKYIFPILTAVIAFAACTNSNNTALVEGEPAIIENTTKDSLMKSYEEEMHAIFSPKDSLADAAVKGYDINLVSGKVIDDCKIKLEYMNTLQLLNATRNNNQKEQLNALDADLSERLVKTLKGGQVFLYISQPSIGAVDLKNLSVTIQDTSGVELYRKDLRDQTAPAVRGVDNLWWIRIEKNIRPPFFINLLNKVDMDNPLQYFVKPVN